MIKKFYLIIAILLLTSSANAEIVKDKNYFKTTIGHESDEITIGGNTKDDPFENRVSFKRWGEDVIELEISSDIVKSKTPKATNGKVEVKDTIGVYYDQFDENTFKFGLTFQTKPSVNSFTFKLKGWENFDFFFQPPLANTDPDGSTWQTNDRGGISRRPADVNGSYAVYHKTKRDHIIGQKNYATGKAFHIYRPRFIDENGDWVWADLHIENGDYTVTIPQSFLDNAVYPVKANDTIGYTSVGASTDNGNNDVFIGFGGSQTTMPASNGTASAIAIGVWHATPAGNVKMCIYSDIGTDLPIARLDTGTGAVAVTRTTAPTNSGEFLSGAITTALAASTKYWLCTNTDNSGVQYAYDSGTGQRLGGAGGSTYAAFPPLTAPVISDNDWSYSFFVTYTASARRRNGMTVVGKG